jgi:hypothetical protein
MFDHDGYRRYLEECGRKKEVAMSCDDWAKANQPPIAAEADPEYTTRIDAQRVTAEFAAPGRLIDQGKTPINEAPLFDGPAQWNLFEEPQ